MPTVLVCSSCGKTAPPAGLGCRCRAEIVTPDTWLQRLRTRTAQQAAQADAYRQAGMCPRCRRTRCTCY